MLPVIFLYYIKNKRGGIAMLKFLSKVAEKYAKSTNTACFLMVILHQPKMPASLIKKD
jgi:cyclic lactone autoinducer peptide